MNDATIFSRGLAARALRLATLAGGLAFAALAPAQTLDFGSCVRIEDLSARLACYDRAAGRAPTGSTGAPAPAPAPAAAPPTSIVPPAAPAIPALPPPAGTPRAPAPSQPLLAPQMPRDPVADFGTNGKAPDALTAKKPKEEAPQEIKQIEARVTAVRTRPEGQQVLTLDNGQVWTQTETRREPQFAVGDVVIIKRGVLGSFLLTLQKGSASTRVQRIS